MDQFTFGALVGGNPIFGHSEQLNEAWAVFGQVDYDVTEKFSITAGIRYSAEEKTFDHCGVGFGDPNSRTCQLVLPTGTIDTELNDNEDWSAVSPRLGFNYLINDDVMVYASWAKGFRSGGYNGRGNTPSSIGPFDEETADNYEIGIKSDLLENRLRLNASAFFMDYEDLQRAAIRPAPGGAGQETVTENVGSAENWGVEFEATALVTDALTVNATLGYLKAENKEWCAAVHGVLATDAPPSGFGQCADSSQVLLPGGGIAGFLVPVDVTNLPPAQSPKWQSRVDVIYDFNLNDAGSLTVAGTWFYRDGNSLVSGGLPSGTLDGVQQYNGEFINPKRDSSHIFDLNATWRSADEAWRVSAFVKNVSDEVFVNTGTFVAGLFNFVQLNHPRHWGLELAYKM